MRRSIKVVIAGAIIASIGVFVVLCAMGASGWNLNSVGNWQEETFVAESNIDNLKIEVDAGQVVVTHSYSIDSSVVVKYQYNDNYNPTIEENNGMLSVKSAKKRWFDIINFIGVYRAPRIEIEVRADVYPDIDLEVNAGTVQLGDGKWGKSIDVELNAGTISVGNVSVEELYVDLNAGAFNAQKIVSDNVTCNISAGAFNAKEIVCSQFECDVSAGAANVKKLDASKIKVDVSAGGVDLGLVGAKSDYNVRVDKSAGSCNVTSQLNASASRSLSIDVSAGSVEVTFGK